MLVVVYIDMDPYLLLLLFLGRVLGLSAFLGRLRLLGFLGFTFTITC